tara:strand:+ start:80 stop:1528 length:1449 start_codon:yes stop_codon:yes gene_type:complete
MTLSTLPNPHPIDMSTTNKFLVETGRIKAAKKSQSLLSASCTVFDTHDSIWGESGISAAINFAIYALQHGAGCAIHLSKLRERGHDNGKGLIASGPCSLIPVFSAINAWIRRGGEYKNGAITATIDANSKDLREFCELPRSVIPWVKRCINLNEGMWHDLEPDIQDLICQGIAAGDLWLAKTRWDRFGNRIFSNVCLEIFIPSRGTCILSHINMGLCELGDLDFAFTDGMRQLCQLHAASGVDRDGYYLSPSEDRQVGLGMVGFANFLALHGVTYAQFADAIELHQGFTHDLMVTPEALRLVKSLQQAIDKAADVAREYQMERAFCIAPTATCSYKHVDRNGYTTTPEIAPPISRLVDRDSATFGVQQVNYGPLVEIASEVGWPTWTRCADGIVRMYQSTDLFHGYSYNTWSDDPAVKYTPEFIETWLASPQTSMYYSLQVMAGTQAKDSVEGVEEDFVFDFSEIEGEACSTEEPFCTSCAE